MLTAALRSLAPRRAAATSLARRAFAAGPADGDTHADFAPTHRGAAGGSAADTIKADIAAHKVFVYMKVRGEGMEGRAGRNAAADVATDAQLSPLSLQGSPDAPQCGFSNMACRVLDAYGVQYGSRNVLADPALREGVKAFSDWPTIPQVYVSGEFVGGADILMAMHQSGELAKALGVEGKGGGG